MSMDPETPPEPTPTPPVAPIEAKPVVMNKRRPGWLKVTLLLVIVAALCAGFWWLGRHGNQPKQSTTTATATTKSSTPTTSKLPGLQLDTKKNYGNKYASGVLPVGDKKYDSSGAKVGYVYACSQYAQNLAVDPGGASTRGPWFSSDGTTYDLNKKAHVQGSVMWQASFTNTVAGATRTIITNDLPTHPTGIFPIMSSDPAYQYDRNPNRISSQSLTFSLTAAPSYGDPQCIGGEVGVMTTGVVLFSGFDAGGRDAGAWEVQDSCSGHPQKDGIYHYHTLSSCIKDTSVKTVIGYALDGFPITGPQVGPNNILTTSDLDECHGITSSYLLDGKTVTGYHYVMTEDFPYSVSCYRATPIQPPGQPHG